MCKMSAAMQVLLVRRLLHFAFTRKAVYYDILLMTKAIMVIIINKVIFKTNSNENTRYHRFFQVVMIRK